LLAISGVRTTEMPTSPQRRHGDSTRQPEPPSARVLLVDDDVNFRAWLALLMRRLGFAVEVAFDGVHALEVMRASGAFDLVIADLEMPRMNGIDLIHEIRETPSLAQQYAVMLTAHGDLDSKVAALTVGYDDFLSKGCTEVEVIAKVIAAKRMLARNKQITASANEWQTIATRDELTGVATRRMLVEEATRTLAEGQEIGIALLDLDDFKPVNDTFGHLTGDRILRDIGALFIARTRANDLLARYGGDEFVLLVRGLPLDDLQGAADRLVTEIQSMQWTANEVTFAMRVTVGIAHSSLLPNANLEQLLEAADRDLYAKKWIKKHPGARPELYEYPGRVNAATVVPLPPELPQKRAREES
jgi:diguanylate cyclase (GGDEF)-like protein